MIQPMNEPVSYYEWVDQIKDLMLDNAVPTDDLSFIGDDKLSEQYEQGITPQEVYNEWFGRYDNRPIWSEDPFSDTFEGS